MSLAEEAAARVQLILNKHGKHSAWRQNKHVWLSGHRSNFAASVLPPLSTGA